MPAARVAVVDALATLKLLDVAAGTPDAAGAVACSVSVLPATGGGWQSLAVHGPGRGGATQYQLPNTPMTALYVYIGGSSPVTLTMTAPGGTSPAPPPTIGLTPGWNLIGPAASTGTQTYAEFVGSTNVSELVDTNGAGRAAGDPSIVTDRSVHDGHGYWLFNGTGGPETLAGGVVGGNTAP